MYTLAGERHWQYVLVLSFSLRCCIYHHQYTSSRCLLSITPPRPSHHTSFPHIPPHHIHIPLARPTPTQQNKLTHLPTGLTDQVAKESKDSTASDHPMHDVDTGATSGGSQSKEHGTAADHSAVRYDFHIPSLFLLHTTSYRVKLRKRERPSPNSPSSILLLPHHFTISPQHRHHVHTHTSQTINTNLFASLTGPRHSPILQPRRKGG